jgi:peptidoglycan/LPS O-acetylase OafA/YrhL
MHENKPLTSIRGIAALYVVCYHLNDWVAPDTDILPRAVFGYGFSAVDIFFILSGFILASVYRDMALRQTGQFLLKRGLRLYPLHVCIMLFLAVAILVAPALHVNMHSDEFHSWHDYPYVFFLVQPFTPFEGGWNNPSWSIGIELLCYVLFPVAIIMLRNGPRLLLATLALGLAVGQAYVLIQAFDSISGLPAIMRGLFGFFLGVTLRLLLESVPRPSPRQASIIEIAASVAIVAAAGLSAPNVIPLASAVLIGVLLFEQGVVARVLSTRVFLWLGHISFSIYMLHDPIVRITGKLLPLHRVPLPMPLAGWVYAAGILTIILIVSTFTYRWIEQPGRHLVHRPRASFTRWRTNASLAGLSPESRADASVESGN